MMHAFHERGIGSIGGVRIRNDSVTELVCSTVEEFLSMNISHEGNHPHTPEDDAHMVSFNSIPEREVIRRFELESFGHAEATASKSVEFCNDRRLHSAIGYCTPGEVHENWKVISMKESLSSIRQSCPELGDKTNRCGHMDPWD